MTHRDRPRRGLPPGWPPDRLEIWPWSPADSAVPAERAAVATTDRLATEVGVEVLRRGGNAVDATVAVALALAVVNPEAGNLGGGGFLLVRTAGGDLAALDHRSVAPRKAGPDMFESAPEDAAVAGHLAVAVPGTVQGLWDAHRRFGTRPWAALVDPAVALARGFTVEERYLRSLEPHIVEGLRRFPASATVFLPGGVPPREGDTLRQEDLARTLERVRDHGPDGFYRGETARRIVAEMERGGGLLDRDDLAAYRTVWREPVRFPYRGRTVVSMPPPSSGGVTLAEIAHILRDFHVAELPWHGARHVHLLAEAWRRAFADRNHYLADPDFVDLPLDALVSPDYAAWRARTIDPDAATPSADVAPGVEAWRESPHTTHVSIVGPAGDAAAFTTTINTWYGSKVVAEGTGVLLNNEMDDFTARPGVPNHFELVQGEANMIAPGKRMLSAMAPTLVLDADGRLSMVLGTPGGSSIITTVFQILSNVVDHGMGLAEALVAPRVHHQHLPDRLDFEPGGLAPDVVAELEALGHRVQERDTMSGDAQAVAVDPDGTLVAVADPRRGGAAAGF